MSNPVCSVSFRLNGVPIENYGLEVINAHELIKEQFIKKTMPSDFNHFDKDLFGLMFGYGKIQIINKDEVYKISPHPTTP